MVSDCYHKEAKNGLVKLRRSQAVKGTVGANFMHLGVQNLVVFCSISAGISQHQEKIVLPNFVDFVEYTIN